MSKELSTKHKWFISIAILLSVVAITLSIITLCSVYPNNNLGFDYLGIIVGMFALLITILIGWQIFSIINFKEAQKETKQLYKKTQYLHKKNQSEIYAAKGEAQENAMYSMFNDYSSDKNNLYAHHVALAVNYYCLADRIDKANQILSFFICWTKPPFSSNQEFATIYINQELKDQFKLLDSTIVNQFKDLLTQVLSDPKFKGYNQ